MLCSVLVISLKLRSSVSGLMSLFRSNRLLIYRWGKVKYSPVRYVNVKVKLESDSSYVMHEMLQQQQC